MRTFELLDRDGLARIGRLATPHGSIDTPALLPVVHPAQGRQSITPEAMRRHFGVQAVITSAYITWRDPALRSAAERTGIHALIGFDGPVMTDSGAFQQHAYGHVEIGPEESIAFQEQIGADIATVLDRFVEPEAPRDRAAEGVRETTLRSEHARAHRSGLLAVPVQGGLDSDLRRTSAEAASRLADVAAIGGVVPLMERYRYGDLVRVLHAVRPALVPGLPVHLFGTGHPMLFALAALFGVDLFDSSAYHKFARRGDLLFVSGTVPLDRVKESICSCRLCAEFPLPRLRSEPPAVRERAVAEHNLLMSLEEIARIRQAVRDGLLWELVEQRAHGHPALLAALGPLLASPDTFLRTEPVSRHSFRVHGTESLERPAALVFGRTLAAFPSPGDSVLAGARPPLLPQFLAHLPAERPDGSPSRIDCETIFGRVPLELSEIYPVGPAVGPDDFTPRPAPRPAIQDRGDGSAKNSDPGRDWTPEWTRRHMSAILRWTYGSEAGSLVERGLVGQRSHRTGRLRLLVWQGSPAFAVGNDGLPRPGWLGGRLLHEVLPAPKLRVEVLSDAVEFVASGRSLFAPFARAADPGLRPGGSVLLVDGQDRLIAVGRLLLAPHEFSSFRRGVAAWVTAHPRRPVPELEPEDDADQTGAAG